MSIRRLAASAAIAAISMLALGAASASATTVIRTDPGGGLLTGSTTIRNTTSNTAVLQTSLGGVTCTRTTFDADLASNSGPSSVTGTITSLTFAGCTDHIPLITITECGLHAGSPLPTIHITADAGGTGGSVQVTDPTVRCAIANSTSACYYTAATATGSANNVTSNLTFANVAVASVSPTTDALGAGLCGTNATFGVTLQHIVQGGTNATITIRPS